jgi:uncharacterized membrane-anchored protein
MTSYFFPPTLFLPIIAAAGLGAAITYYFVKRNRSDNATIAAVFTVLIVVLMAIFRFY